MNNPRTNAPQSPNFGGILVSLSALANRWLRTKETRLLVRQSVESSASIHPNGPESLARSKAAENIAVPNGRSIRSSREGGATRKVRLVSASTEHKTPPIGRFENVRARLDANWDFRPGAQTERSSSGRHSGFKGSVRMEAAKFAKEGRFTIFAAHASRS